MNDSGPEVLLSAEMQKPQKLPDIALRRGSINTIRIEGIEYKGEISLEQVIACKKRKRRYLSKSASITRPETPGLSRTNNEETRFTEEFYDSIEAFLDAQELFIVSPTPVRYQKEYWKLIKTKSEYISEILTPEKQLAEASDYKFPATITNEPETEVFPHSKLGTMSLPKNLLGKGPSLGKVSASSLIQRRKRFETVDCIIHK